MITAEVQQVTTHNKTKEVEWEVQDEIRIVVEPWVEKANEANIALMRQEGAAEASSSTKEATMGQDLICQAHMDCLITLMMDKLLYLVPRFQ